jgi:hypothetical protein
LLSSRPEVDFAEERLSAKPGKFALTKRFVFIVREFQNPGILVRNQNPTYA